MSGSRGKRQRRSYSCGPCKMLKIKCDLQLPCSSCIKFKREDKCRASPPQPPSETELKVIRERKERMKKRRTGDNSSFEEENFGHSWDNSRQMNTSSDNGDSQYNSPRIFPTDLTEITQNIFQLLDEDLLHQLQSYFIKKNVKLYFQTDEYVTLPLYYSTKGANVFADSIKHESVRKVQIEVEDVRLLKLIIPNINDTCRLFLGHFKSYKEDLFEIVDYGAIIRLFLRFSNLIRNADGNKRLTLNPLELRAVALGLPILASGLLMYPNMRISNQLSNSETVNRWILLSKKFKENFKSADSLFDIVYLMVWYFIIDNYYHQECMLSENHFEYNHLLSNLLFNKEYMDHIINRNLDFSTLSEDRVSEFKVIITYWLRIRLIELNVFYFQYKSSLLRSNNILKNSVIPDDKMLKYIYGDNLELVKTDILKGIYLVAKSYFNQFKSGSSPGGSVREFIKSYHSVHANAYEVVGYKIENYEKTLKTSNNELTSETSLQFFINQLYTLAFIRWLTFLKVEQGYFTSLRFLTYLSSMVCSLNHYIYLDNLVYERTNGSKSLLVFLGESHSYYPLEFFFHSCILQRLFITCLKLFVNKNEDQSNVLNLQELYEVMNTRFERFSAKFIRDFRSTELGNINLYKTFFNFLLQINDLHANVEFNSQPDIDEFFTIMGKHLQNLNLFVDLYFGCKSTMINYLGRLWFLFEFVSQNKNATLPITSTLNFNHELIMKYKDSFIGFGIKQEILDEYLITVVDPSLASQKAIQ